MECWGESWLFFSLMNDMSNLEDGDQWVEAESRKMNLYVAGNERTGRIRQTLGGRTSLLKRGRYNGRELYAGWDGFVFNLSLGFLGEFHTTRWGLREPWWEDSEAISRLPNWGKRQQNVKEHQIKPAKLIPHCIFVRKMRGISTKSKCKYLLAKQILPFRW